MLCAEDDAPEVTLSFLGVPACAVAFHFCALQVALTLFTSVKSPSPRMFTLVIDAVNVLAVTLVLSLSLNIQW